MRKGRWLIKVSLPRVLWLELQRLALADQLSLGQYVGEVLACKAAESRLASLAKFKLQDRFASGLARPGAVHRGLKRG